MIDRIDKKILEILQSNARISNQELAEKVSLSPTPCLRRVAILEEKGFIQRYVSLLDPKKLGLSLQVMILVGLDNHPETTLKHFEKAIDSLPEVIQCYLIAGQKADYLLKVVMPDMDYYQKFLLKKLVSIKGVNSVQSSFILRNIVDKTALPLVHINA